MFTLIGIGVAVAWLYSLIAVVFPDIFPQSVRNDVGMVAVYFEAATVITTLVLLGQVLELKAREQTSSAIKQLLGLAPNRIYLSSRSTSASISGFAPVKKYLLMAVLLKAVVMLMSRWLTVNRCRSENSRVTYLSALQ